MRSKRIENTVVVNITYGPIWSLYYTCQEQREDNCCCLFDQSSHRGGDKSAMLVILPVPRFHEKKLFI